VLEPGRGNTKVFRFTAKQRVEMLTHHGAPGVYHKILEVAIKI